MSMGFKNPTCSLDFAYLALANCLEQNRSIKLMEQLSGTINWSLVESILLSHYNVGTSEEGVRDNPPLMLFKCLLLQKWFLIPSDPELENQINDRLSFKTFLGLSYSQPAPDHSTFSRFRSRLQKEAMDAINSEILR
jgi:IS5 family transposase